MDQDTERRPYSSPLRDRRARETRRAILAAARRLILERGFGATTMRDIASAAGVAVQTIYASIGTKQDILTAFIDQMEEDARIDEFAARFLATDDPRAHLRLRAEASRAIFGEGIEVIELLIQAQGTSPDIIALLEEGDGRHRQSVKVWIVDRWPDAAIRADLTREETLDIITTLSGSDVYRWLVRRYGWSPERYEAWLYRALTEAVLDG